MEGKWGSREWWWMTVNETYLFLEGVYRKVGPDKTPVAHNQEEIDALLDVAEYIKDHEGAEAAHQFVLDMNGPLGGCYLNKVHPDFVSFRKKFVGLMKKHGYKGSELFRYLCNVSYERDPWTVGVWPTLLEMNLLDNYAFECVKAGKTPDYPALSKC